MNNDFFIRNADRLFEHSRSEREVLNSVNDKSYVEFINQINGGFFFNKSLIVYGFGHIPQYSSFVEMNLLINSLYVSIAPRAQYFGCDFLGNQFAFFENNVHFFNLETGKFEFLSPNFEEWKAVISSDLDYYTGQSLVIEWETKIGKLDFSERLCPKKPFVIGGEYVVDNLFALNMKSLLQYNYEIAKQIHHLPDGAEIVLKIIK